MRAFSRLIPGLLLFVSFLATHASAQDEVKWKKLNPKGSGFTVELPGEAKAQTRTIRPVPDSEVVIHLFTVSGNGGKSVFLVGYHDLEKEPESDEKTKEILTGGVKGSVINALGELSKHEKITLDDFPGRHFEYIGRRFNQKIQATSRIYLVKRRIYQVTVLRDPTVKVDAEITRFFESFKLVPDEMDDDKAAKDDNGKSDNS